MVASDSFKRVDGVVTVAGPAVQNPVDPECDIRRSLGVLLKVSQRGFNAA
jgi:hypothetical protein